MEDWDAEETFQEIVQTVDDIQTLFQATAASGNGIIFYVF